MVDKIFAPPISVPLRFPINTWEDRDAKRVYSQTYRNSHRIPTAKAGIEMNPWASEKFLSQKTKILPTSSKAKKKQQTVS